MCFLRLSILFSMFLSFPSLFAGSMPCKSVLSFQRNDLMILNEIITEQLRYDSLNPFKEDSRILAYEFNSMPNYYRSGYEFNLHYRLIIHFQDFSTTIIYDSVEREVRDNLMHMQW